MLNLSYYGVNETRQYNSLLQLTRMTANPGGGANVMDMQYNYSATQNNGRILSSNDYVTGENVSYTYDAVNRLTGASAGSIWGETYSYDGFGNLTGKNATQPPAPTLGVSYDANNHQVGLTYDANGNQSMDAQGATYYNWNGENRLAQAWQWGGLEATTWYSYDPWGRRVMKDVNLDPGDNGYTGGAWEFYFYGITGQKLATVSCSYFGGQANCHMSVSNINVYFGGKLVAKEIGNAVVTDRLGSVRARNSSGSWTQMSYFPYGEERTVTPDGLEKFGTYYRDGPGQDYAEQRYYAPGVGRFFTPDPMKGGKAARPSSWNKYLYVHGDPVNFRDPGGLNEASPDDGCGDEEDDMPCFSVTGYGDGDDGGGGGGGGYYDPCDYDPEGCIVDDPTPVPDPQKNPKKGKGGKKRPQPNPCNNTTAVNFDKAYLGDAQALAAKLNVDPLWILAVGATESTYGTSDIAQRENNFFGIHWGSVAAANGATQSTTNPIVASWDWGTDGFMGSGNAMVALAIKDGAAGVTNALQFFTDIHKQFGVPNASYASDMVKVVATVAARVKCP